MKCFLSCKGRDNGDTVCVEALSRVDLSDAAAGFFLSMSDSQVAIGSFMLVSRRQLAVDSAHF